VSGRGDALRGASPFSGIKLVFLLPAPAPCFSRRSRSKNPEGVRRPEQRALTRRFPGVAEPNRSGAGIRKAIAPAVILAFSHSRNAGTVAPDKLCACRTAQRSTKHACKEALPPSTSTRGLRAPVDPRVVCEVHGNG